MEINPILMVIGGFFLAIIVAFIPSKEQRLLKKAYSKPITKLDSSVVGKVARIQGKVTAVTTTNTPMFEQEAVIYEAGFYTLSERKKRDPDWHSHESNWRLQKSEKVKNDFLLEDNGWYALIKTSSSIDILNKTKNDINQYDIGFISSLNRSDKKFEDIKPNLDLFMDKFEIPKFAKNNYYNYETLRVKEQLLLDGDFVSVVGLCSVESIDNFPELEGIVHPMTEEIIVVENTQNGSMYITDDMKTLYG